MTATRSITERFWSKVRRSAGCWEWTASRTKRGYGQFLLTTGRPILAHRMVWVLTHGVIPDGLYVCHKCDNPQCVRPDHLFLGSQGDNMRDMSAKGRANPWGAKLTACTKGHPYNATNTHVTAEGERQCRVCRRLKRSKTHRVPTPQ